MVQSESKQQEQYISLDNVIFDTHTKLHFEKLSFNSFKSSWEKVP